MFKWWLFDWGRGRDVCGGMEVSTFLRCNWLEEVAARATSVQQGSTVQYRGVQYSCTVICTVHDNYAAAHHRQHYPATESESMKESQASNNTLVC